MLPLKTWNVAVHCVLEYSRSILMTFPLTVPMYIPIHDVEKASAKGMVLSNLNKTRFIKTVTLPLQEPLLHLQCSDAQCLPGHLFFLAHQSSCCPSLMLLSAQGCTSSRPDAIAISFLVFWEMSFRQFLRRSHSESKCWRRWGREAEKCRAFSDAAAAWEKRLFLPSLQLEAEIL